jgi:hypothetical protein
MMWAGTGFVWLRIGMNGGCCERGNETSLSVNEGTVLTNFETVSFSRFPFDGVSWLVRMEELTGEGVEKAA